MGKSLVFGVLALFATLNLLRAEVKISAPGAEWVATDSDRIGVTVKFANAPGMAETVTWGWRWRDYQGAELAAGKGDAFTLKPGEAVERALSVPLGEARAYRLVVNWEDSAGEHEKIVDRYASQPVGKRRFYLLNGRWEIATRKGGFPRAKANRAEPPTIPADLKWGACDVPRGMAPWPTDTIFYYRRSFSLPEWARGESYELWFEGIGRRAHVWLNDRYLGYFEGAWNTWRLPVEGLRAAGENRLLVALTNSADQKQDPTRGEKRAWPIGHPGNYYNGIYDNVYLAAAPNVRVEDWRWAFDLAKRELTVTARLTNGGTSPFKGKFSASLLDKGKETRFTAAREVVIPKSASTEVSLVVPVDGAELWWPKMEDAPGAPYLYGLSLASRDDSGALIDETLKRVGLREFNVVDGDYRINGKKVHLWARGAPGWGGRFSSEGARISTAANSAAGVISRIHCNPTSRNYTEIADEQGHLVQIEMPLYGSCAEYPLDDPDFWENFNTCVRDIIREYRDFPSVVSYSLENEMFLCGSESVPGSLDRVADLWRMATALDPTRPALVNGDGDLRGRIDTINLHYPRHPSRWQDIPADCFWLKRGEKHALDLYPGSFYWDPKKPLEIGEDLWGNFSALPNGVTPLLGDDAYESDARALDGHNALATLYMRGYRASGVSYYQPWSPTSGAARTAANHPIAAYVSDLTRTFAPGQAVNWNVKVHNDTLSDHALTVELIVGTERRVNSPIAIEAGGFAESRLAFTAPGQDSDALIMVRDETGRVRFSEKLSLRVRPFARLTRPEGLEVFIYDPTGKTTAALSARGLTAKPLASLKDIAVAEQGLLIVGHDALGVTWAGAVSAMERFVAGGGKVLVLAQSDYPSSAFCPGNIQISGVKVANTAFIVNKSHPFFAGLEDRDFHFWPTDHHVARRLFFEPSSGGAVALLRSGNRDGLGMSPLIWQPWGKGWYLFSGLELLGKLNESPTPSRFLANVMRFAERPVPARASTAVIGDDKAIEGGLRGVGLIYDKIAAPAKLPKNGLAIVLPSALPGEWFGPLQAFASRGGKVWWMSWEGPGFDKLDQEFAISPFSPVSEAYQVILEDRQAFPYLINYDMYWRTGGAPFSAVRFNLDQALAPRLIKLDQLRWEDGSAPNRETWSAPKRFGSVTKFIKNKLLWTVSKDFDGMFYLGVNARIASKAPAPSKQLNAAYIIPATSWDMAGRYCLRVNGKEIPLKGEASSVDVTIYSQSWAMPYGTLISTGPIRLTPGDTVEIFTPAPSPDLWVAGLEVAAKRELGEIQALTRPWALTRLPVGKGAIILDGVNWSGALGSAISGKACQAMNAVLAGWRAEFRSELLAGSGDTSIFLAAVMARLFSADGAALPTFDGTAAMHGRYRVALKLWATGQGGAWTVPAEVPRGLKLIRVDARVANVSPTSWDIAPAYRVRLNGEIVKTSPLEGSGEAFTKGGRWNMVYGALVSTEPLNVGGGDTISVALTRPDSAFVAGVSLVEPDAYSVRQLIPAKTFNERLSGTIAARFPGGFTQRLDAALALSSQGARTVEIPVDVKARELILIQGFYHPWTDFAEQTRGSTLGTYQIEYADGAKESFPIAYKENVATPLDREYALSGATLAWKGKLPLSAKLDAKTSLLGEWIQEYYDFPVYAAVWRGLRADTAIRKIVISGNSGGVSLIFGVFAVP